MIVIRAAVIATLALALFAAPFAAEAQQTGKVPRVGVLGVASPEASPASLALRQGLRELGYVEGQTIALEFRWARGKIERFPDLAAELVRLKVDIIVAFGEPAMLAAQKATRTIPVVMVWASDPVALGLVASLARPGGNITGLAFQPEVTGKWLQLLREVAPNSARIAVLTDSREPYTQNVLRETEATARALGVQLQVVEAQSSTEIDRAFTAIVRERAAGIIIQASTATVAYRAHIAQLAAQHRLPTMCSPQLKASCLMSYGSNPLDLARRAAYFVDRILKGTKPADLPVERPTKFELVINLKTAKALGLTMPPSLLLRADQIIE